MGSAGGGLHQHTTLQNVFLMIGCVVLTLGSINSFYQGHALQKANKKRRDAETEDSDPDVSAAADAATETKAASAQIAGFCTAVAAVQYLVLFQGGGRVLLSNGEEFAYIVYIDWILGTPCLLYNLATLIHCPTSNIIQLITYDIMMIGCGFIAALSCDSQGWRYCWFVISSVFFFGICYTLRVQSKELLELLGEEEKEIGTLYKNLLYLFLICWLVYPILFIVGSNGGVLEPSTFLEVITVPLEIVAKGIAGIIIAMTYSKIERIKLKNQEDTSKGVELTVAPQANFGAPADPMQAMMMQMMMQQQQQQIQAPARVDPMQQMMLQMQQMMQQQQKPQQVYQQPEPVAPITPRGGFQMPITPRGMSFAQPTTPVLQTDDSNQTAASSGMPVLSPQQMQMLFQQMQQQSRQ